jgi:hypothetical protein
MIPRPLARIVVVLVAAAALACAGGSPAPAQQVFTPQSGAGLSVSFTTERMGGSRVLVFGEVRNGTPYTYERVVVLAEGLDDGGKVVSRGRGYVPGTIGPKTNSSFELRMLASGSERRYRVTVDSFQQVQN